MGQSEYVNQEINNLHSLLTDLYESMMDNEYNETVTICNQLIDQLKEIKLNYTDETLL
jgi:flagellar hook-associated protein FlgK